MSRCGEGEDVSDEVWRDIAVVTRSTMRVAYGWCEVLYCAVRRRCSHSHQVNSPLACVRYAIQLLLTTCSNERQRSARSRYKNILSLGPCTT